MRHGKKFNHLGRKAAHRKAMLANMACSLIEHKRIKTTLAKAKALRLYIEPLITKSKNDTTHSRRTVFSYLKQKEAVTELFGDVSTKIADRPGGYTRILKLGNRLGDNAQMAFIELVDYNETYTTDKPMKKKTRRRGGSKTKIEVSTETITDVVEVTEDIKEERSKEVTSEEVEVVIETEESAEEKTQEVASEEAEVVTETEESAEEKTQEVASEEAEVVTETEESAEETKEEESNDSSEEEKSE